MIRIVFRGDVQGVGFRYFVKRFCDEHVLTGYVKNLVNGDVEVVVSGGKFIIDALIEACKQQTTITEAYTEDYVYKETFTSFEIKR
jgi:acylphosphatase